MKKFIIHWALLALVVYFLLPRIIDGIIIDVSRAGIIAAILFAFINLAVKPIIRIVTLPLSFITLGLFGLIINVLLFWFVASVLDGITVVNLIAAAWGALAMTVSSWILGKVID